MYFPASIIPLTEQYLYKYKKVFFALFQMLAKYLYVMQKS